MDRLLISVLGNPNAGKSRTWYRLFGRKVRTGTHTRRLNLTLHDSKMADQFVEIFLINGSPTETDKEVKKILGKLKKLPRIVLCSMQYTSQAFRTFDFFRENNYQIYCQWLNPGYSDPEVMEFDRLGIVNYLLSHHATVTMQDGHDNPSARVQLIREFIYGWAEYRGLIDSG